MRYNDVLEFGQDLLESGDLDPIYLMLYRARIEGLLSDARLKAWMLCYWFFYNAGVASYVTEAPNFYAACRWGYENRWPRGTERRHFRGDAGRSCLNWFADMFPEPQTAVDWASCLDVRKVLETEKIKAVHSFVIPIKFNDVKERVTKWPLFGPWIAFKIADMLDRCLELPVDFSDCALDMYEEPTKSALIVASQNLWSYESPQEAVSGTVARLTEKFNALGYLAPPDFKRPLNLQEIETILCKYKSHRNGHYPIGKDTIEIRHELAGRGKLAARLAKFLPLSSN